MKTENDDLLVYDEDEAVKFIQNYLKTEKSISLDDTKIEYVLDVIYDYYDENGLIEEDTTEEASIDEEEMLKFIVQCVKNENMNLSEEEIQLILEGEYEYGKSTGIYD